MATARELYEKYQRCVVAITSLDEKGDERIGTGFHIGDGWIATARHVVQDRSSIKVVTPPPESSFAPRHTLFPSDENVDLALLETDFKIRPFGRPLRESTKPRWADHIALPGMFDDWIGDDFVMTSTVLLGYPPVPLASGLNLVASRGEVMAVVDVYDKRGHPLFVTSSMPRGGFSGGPVLSEFDLLIGVQTDSMVSGDQSEELGYGAAISPEPLWSLLFEHRVFPASNKEMAYLLRDAYGFDGSEFGLTKDERDQLDELVRNPDDDFGPG